MGVFVPFLGDFLSIPVHLCWSWCKPVFVPFLGDFLSMNETTTIVVIPIEFSSPFLGTFFQYGIAPFIYQGRGVVFVPFLGDFLSIV